MPAERQQIRSLDAPGVMVRKPAEPNKIGDAMQSLLGQMADTSQVVVRTAEENDIRRAMEAESQNKPVPVMLTKKGIDFAFERRAAMDMAAMTTDDWQAELDRKTTEAPDMDMAQFVQQRVDVRATNAPAAYRNYIKWAYIQNITQVLDRRSADARENHFQEGLAGLIVLPVGDESVAQKQQLLKEAQQSNIAPSKFLAAYYSGKMAMLKAQGTPDALREARLLEQMAGDDGVPQSVAGVADDLERIVHVKSYNDIRNGVITATEPGEAEDILAAGLDGGAVTPAENAELTEYIKAKNAKKLAEAQSTASNALGADAMLGKITPEAFADDVNRRIGLPDTDPQHMDWTTGYSMLNALAQKQDFDANMATVLESQSTGKVALLPQHDKAADKLGVEEGYLAGYTDGDVVSVSGIASPFRAALAWNRGQRVTTTGASIIKSGLAGDDASIAKMSALTLGFLHVASPALAESVMDGMTPQAKLRAQYLTTRLDMDKPVTGADTAAYEAAMEQRVSGIMDAAFRLKPVDLPHDQAINIALKKDAQDKLDKPKAFADLSDYIKENLPTELNDAGLWGQDLILTPNVVNTFDGLVAEEIRFAIAEGHDNTTATDIAMPRARARLYRALTPISWNGVTRFSGTTNMPRFRHVEQTLMADVAKLKLSADMLESLQEDFHPEWASNYNAFAFVSNEGEGTFTIQGKNGTVPLLINPSIPESQVETQTRSNDLLKRAMSGRAK